MRLTPEADDKSFSRLFQLEAVDDPQNVRLVASGQLTRRIGEARRPLTITLDTEEYARKLRLLITDYSNQMLSISSIEPNTRARQLIFEMKEAPALPLGLFFGNPKATVPHYDFEKNLPTTLPTALVRAEAGETQETKESTIQSSVG